METLGDGHVEIIENRLREGVIILLQNGNEMKNGSDDEERQCGGADFEQNDHVKGFLIQPGACTHALKDDRFYFFEFQKKQSVAGVQMYLFNCE
jgi:hypothetical protein